MASQVVGFSIFDLNGTNRRSVNVTGERIDELPRHRQPVFHAPKRYTLDGVATTVKPEALVRDAQLVPETIVA